VLASSSPPPQRAISHVEGASFLAATVSSTSCCVDWSDVKGVKIRAGVQNVVVRVGAPLRDRQPLRS
jgi:hypothetical protein